MMLELTPLGLQITGIFVALDKVNPFHFAPD